MRRHSVRTGRRDNVVAMTEHYEPTPQPTPQSPPDESAAPLSQRPPIWSIRTVAVAAAASVVLAAGAGAALASISDGSADGFGTGGPRMGGPASTDGQPNTQPGQGNGPQGQVPQLPGGSTPDGFGPDGALPDGSLPDLPLPSAILERDASGRTT